MEFDCLLGWYCHLSIMDFHSKLIDEPTKVIINIISVMLQQHEIIKFKIEQNQQKQKRVLLI